MDDKGQSSISLTRELIEAQAEIVANAKETYRLASNQLAPIIEAVAASDHQFRAMQERMQDVFKGAKDSLLAIEGPMRQAIEEAQRANTFQDSLSRIAELHDERLRELTASINFPTAFLSDNLMLSIRNTVEHARAHIVSPDTVRLVAAGAQLSAAGTVAISAKASLSSSAAPTARAVDVRAEFDSWLKGLTPAAQLLVLFWVYALLPSVFAALAKVAIERALSEKEASVQTTIVNEIYVTHGWT